MQPNLTPSIVRSESRNAVLLVTSWTKTMKSLTLRKPK